MYVHPGDELASRGLAIGLAPNELQHARSSGRHRRGHGHRAQPGSAPGISRSCSETARSALAWWAMCTAS
jgi:hypothetical protein